MPRRVPAKSLLESCVGNLSKLIVHCIEHHVADYCTYCDNAFLDENCTYLQTWKKALGELPETLKTDLHCEATKCTLPKWADDSRNNPDYGQSFAQEPGYKIFEISYLCAFLLEGNGMKLNGLIWENYLQNLLFVKRFGKYITGYPLGSELNCCIRVLHYCGANLTIVSLDSVDNKLLKLIGMRCPQVKELEGKISSPEYLLSGLLNLMYQDPGTKLRENPLCSTIEALHLYGKRFAIQQEGIKEAAQTVLLKLPNLVNIEKMFTIADMLIALQSHPEAETKIEKAYSGTFRVTDVDHIRKHFPNLEKIYLESGRHSVETMFSLHLIPSLISVQVEPNEVLSLYNGILSNEWPNLKELTVRSGSQINISLIAERLPQLEHLVILDSYGIAWDSKTYFKGLKDFSCYSSKTPAEVDSFHWFRSFCSTIERIIFSCTCKYGSNYGSYSVFPQSALTTFEEDNYPELQELSMGSITYNEDMLKSFLERFPQLKKFSSLICNNLNEKAVIMKYLEENNIDCSIVILEQR